MGLLQDIVRGFSDGLASTQGPARTRDGSEPGRIHRFCRELGWSIDEEEGNRIILHFGRRSDGTLRKVSILSGDAALVTISVMSNAIIPGNKVPGEILGHLLMRNMELGVGAWHIQENANDDAAFRVAYPALGPGLTAGVFRHICQELVKEAVEFDAKLRRANLL